jgi:membrane protein DedA with SNARE-associated domain
MDVAIGLWPFFIRYGYTILILGIALENVGLPLPGEVFLFAAGLLASTGSFKLLIVIALGTAGAVVGDSLGYLLGRLGGDRLSRLYCRMTLGSAQCVQKTHEYFTRRGGGLLVYDALGALLWATLAATAGYFFGSRWERLLAGYRWSYGFILLGVLLVALGYVLMKSQRRRRYGPASSF